MGIAGGCLLHSRKCKVPSQFLDDNRSYGSLEVLAFYAKGCTGAPDWTVYGLAILSYTSFLRVSETVSVRRGGLQDAFFSFRGAKTSRRMIGREMGKYCRAWACWLRDHGGVSRNHSKIHCTGGCRWLEAHIADALAGLEWEELMWHAWRRAAAALLKHLGVPLGTIMAWVVALPCTIASHHRISIVPLKCNYLGRHPNAHVVEKCTGDPDQPTSRITSSSLMFKISMYSARGKTTSSCRRR